MPNDDLKKAIEEAEKVLSDNRTSIDVIIRAIRQVNPTKRIGLNPEDRETAYKLKSDLQNHLLIQYGEFFDLEPAAWDENEVFIRHKYIPLLNACHAILHQLSEQALAQVRKGDGFIQRKEHHRKEIRVRTTTVDTGTLNGIVEKAREYMDNYEYDSARELLASMAINSKTEVSTFLRGISILTELAAYDLALELLFSLPKDLQNDDIREIAANVYWHNGQYSDARGLFEECAAIKELKKESKESIVRYADILHREGESRSALDWLNHAEGMDGFVEGIDALKKSIHTALAEESRPYLDTAKREFDADNFDLAEDAANKAIAIFSECVEAREIVSMIREIRNDDYVKSLWQNLSTSSDRTERLNILRKLKSVITDTKRLNEIEKLIEKELEEERQEGLKRLACEIKGNLEKKEYDNAFDKIFALLKNKDGNELILCVAQEYPQIECIVNNNHLLRLKPQEAKECWLSYLHLGDVSPEHETDKLGMLLSKAGKAFCKDRKYMEIKKIYNEIVAERSRNRIQEYLTRLSADDINLDDAEDIALKIKREVKNLPTDVEKYLSECEGILKKLRKEKEGPHNLRCLRDSLLIGDTETTAEYRQKIGDTQAVAQIESEVRALFAVESKPVEQLTLNSDIASLEAKPADGLEFLGSIEDQVFFKIADGDRKNLIILDLCRAQTWLYTLKGFNYDIHQVIYYNADKNEYGLLCTGNNAYHCVKATLNGHDCMINATICLDMLRSEESIEKTFFLEGNYRYLYALCYDPADLEDNVYLRTIRELDLYQGIEIRNKKVEYTEQSHGIISTGLLVYGEFINKKLRTKGLYGHVMSINVDRANQSIYLIKNEHEKYSLTILDFELKIKEEFVIKNGLPYFGVLTSQKYFASKGRLIYIEDSPKGIEIYDFEGNKKEIKNIDVNEKLKGCSWYFDSNGERFFSYNYLSAENKLILTDITPEI